LKDVTFRLVPVTDTDGEAMLTSLRGYPILKGVRGEPPVCFAALHEAMARLSYLVSEFPQIQEMDINPFLVFPERARCVVVDARMTVKN
jgi:acetyltransferase